MNSQNRTTITLDDETNQIRKEHNINLSAEVREYLKQKYGSVQLLEEKREELEAEKRRELERKQEAERRINEIEDRLSRINNLMTRNDIIEKIKDRPEWQARVQSSVTILRQAKSEGDSRDQLHQYVEKQAEVCITGKDSRDEEIPVEKEAMEETLKLLAEI